MKWMVIVHCENYELYSSYNVFNTEEEAKKEYDKMVKDGGPYTSLIVLAEIKEIHREKS